MNKGNNDPFLSKGEFLVYQTADGQVKLDVRLEKETLWMTQNDMAQLFQCSSDNISLHLKNIYDEGELTQVATAEEFSVVRQEGKRQVRRKLTYYNLDAIISVGYRVKSIIATRFRIWATERLKEYIVKGFTMDDERLKNPPVKGLADPDYFDELLERIRDIRASERRMYLRVREIFALAADTVVSLPKIVQWFKAMTTNEYIRNVKQNNWDSFRSKLWQGKYWERIIRDQPELNRIRAHPGIYHQQSGPARYRS